MLNQDVPHVNHTLVAVQRWELENVFFKSVVLAEDRFTRSITHCRIIVKIILIFFKKINWEDVYILISWWHSAYRHDTKLLLSHSFLCWRGIAQPCVCVCVCVICNATDALFGLGGDSYFLLRIITIEICVITQHYLTTLIMCNMFLHISPPSVYFFISCIFSCLL